MSANPLSTFGPGPFAPLPFSFDSEQAAAAAARQRAIEAAQRAAAAAEAAARQAAATAAAARKKADASLQAANAADAAAAKKGATQADKAAATKADAQAQADEADAQKTASAADVAQKNATLKDSQRDDLTAGRDPSNPSAKTVQAQADYDAAVKEDALVDPPAGQPDPLATAQADTAAKFKAFVAAAQSGNQTKEDQAQGAWLDAVQYQMQVAALEAAGKGQDVNAAVQAQATQVQNAVAKDGTFDPASVAKALQPIADPIGSAPPDQLRSAMEYQSELTDGQNQVAAAQAQVATLQSQADAADAAAAPVDGPYLPGHGPQVSPFTLAASPAASGTAPALLTPAQSKAVAAHAALDAAQDKLDTLEAVYGSTDPKDSNNDTIGTLQANRNASVATAAASQAKQAYFKTLAAPGSSAKDIATAYDAWQNAVDQQTLAVKLQASVSANAQLLQAKQNQAAAQAAVNALPPGLLPVLTTNGTGQLPSLLMPDAAPGVAATPQQQLASANAALATAQGNAQNAQTALNQASTDLYGGNGAVPLNITQTLDDAGTATTTLANAQSALAAAQATLRAAQDGTTGTSLAAARTQVGRAQQAVDAAQAGVNLVDAMQNLRNAQMATSGGAQPANLDALLAAVRKAQNAASTVSGTPLLTQDAETTLTTQTLPSETRTLNGLDGQIQKLVAAGDTGSAKLEGLMNQRDWLDHTITLQKAQVTLSDLQVAALAAPYERSLASPPCVDLTDPTHSDAADAALTWGILPPTTTGGPIRLSGLPSNIQPQDVTVEKDGNNWYVTFDKDAGSYAVRYSGGRVPMRSYVDGSKAGDIAIQKGYKYKLDPATAQLWEATNTDPQFGNSALVTATTNYNKALQQVELDPQTNPDGSPVLVNGLPSTSVAKTVDGQLAPTIDFNVDQGPASAAAAANVATLKATAATAASAAKAAPSDAALKTAAATAQSNYQVALAYQSAVDAVQKWQQANLARQLDDANARAGIAPTMCFAKSPQETEDVLHQTAVSAVAQWQSAQQKATVATAQSGVDSAQTAFDQWRSAHAYLSPATAAESAPGQALQAAQGQLDVAKRGLTLAATVTSDAQQKAYIAQNLPPDQQSDPRQLYQLFMKNPQVMAQSIINEDYVQNGGVAKTYGGSAALSAMVTGELNTSTATTKKIVDQITSVGGDDAKVTIIPVVYALNADTDQGGGIVKTALFKVQDPNDPSSFKYVDDSGAHYDSVDDYRANNNLPVNGVNLAMPEDGNFTLDANGNVKLFTGDARTETGWQTFTRVTHFDQVVGVVGLAAGIVMEVGSGGLLTEVAAPLAVASTSLYFATTSAQDLANRSDHGLSIDPFTDRQAGLDWLNLGASVVALPGMGSTMRIGVEADAATNAGVDVDRIAVVGTNDRAVTLTHRAFQAGTDVTDNAEDYHLIAGSSSWTNGANTAAKLLGGAATADSVAYMGQNWSKMTSGDRWQQGSMLLANLIPTVAATAASRIGGGTRPAVQTTAVDTSVDTVSGTLALSDDLVTPVGTDALTGQDSTDGAGADETASTRSAQVRPAGADRDGSTAPDVTLADDRIEPATPTTASTNGATHLQQVDLHGTPVAAPSAVPPSADTAVTPVASTSATPEVDSTTLALPATAALLSDPTDGDAAAGTASDSDAAVSSGRSPAAAAARKQARLERLEESSAELLKRVVSARTRAQAEAANDTVTTRTTPASGRGVDGAAAAGRPAAGTPLPADPAIGVDDRGWTMDAARYGPQVLDKTLFQVLDAGGRLEGADFVVHPLEYDTESAQATGLLLDPRDEGLAGIARAGDANVDPATTPVAYPTLEAALAGPQASSRDHGIVIVARSGDEPGGDASAQQVIARVAPDHPDHGRTIESNPRFEGSVRVAWPDGWKPGDPLISGSGDSAVDLLNAAPGKGTLAVNMFRRRPADLRLFADGQSTIGKKSGLPVTEEFPVPEGYYAIEMHGASIGRWVQDADGRMINAAELAVRIRQDPRWDGKPVFLAVCQAGEGHVQFAQELSSELKVDVYGTNGMVELRGSEPGTETATVISKMLLARTTDNPHQPDPRFERFQRGLPIAQITEIRNGEKVVVFGPGKGLGVRPEPDAGGEATEPGTTTLSTATSPGASITPPAGAPQPFKAAKMRLPEFTPVTVDTMDWTTWATQADIDSAARPLPPLDQAGPVDTAVAGALRSQPANGSKDFFVVSRRGPGRVIVQGKQVDASTTYGSFDEASAAIAANPKMRDGAWVHRARSDAVDPKVLKARKGHVKSDEITGSIFVDGQGKPTSLVVANPDSAAWSDLATSGGAARGSDGSLRAPSRQPVTLDDSDAVIDQADRLVAQYQPGVGRPAPAGTSELVDAITQRRVHGTRARFVVSDKPPRDAFGDGTSLDGAPQYRGFKKAREAAAAAGGSWVYRAERPQLRPKGEPVAWDAVGGVHVYDDGTVMPVGVARTEAAAWSRPGAGRVVASAATGAGVFAAATLGVRYGVPLPHMLNDALTLSAVGTLVRSTAKVARFGHAGRWQRSFSDMRQRAEPRAQFESALNQVGDLDGSTGNQGLSAAVANFRDADGGLTGVKVKDRAPAIRSSLQDLREAVPDQLFDHRAADLFKTLDEKVDSKAEFDFALDRHERFANRLSNNDAFVRRFLTGMHDEKPDANGQAETPVSDFVTQVGTVRGALAAWAPAKGAVRPSDDELASNLLTTVTKLHVAPKLRPASSNVRRTLDFVQFTTYAFALGYNLRDGVTGPLLSQISTLAFDTAFAADAVRIAGSRLAGVMDRNLSKGATRTASSKLYTQWLPAIDTSSTTFAGMTTLAGSAQDLAGLKVAWHGIKNVATSVKPSFVWQHDLRGAVASFYAGVNAPTWWTEARRRFADPAVDDSTSRRWQMRLKVGGGLVAAALVVDSSVQKYFPPPAAGADDKKKKGPPTPVPTASPGSTPGASPSPGITASTGPGSTPWTGPGTAPPATRTPAPPAGPPRQTPAQVVVTAGDPRRDTLWGIARSSERDLLSPSQISAIHASGGGSNAETLDALSHLFQLNPQRGFRPDLMDGVASAVPGDPDTLVPGWVIDVGNTPA